MKKYLTRIEEISSTVYNLLEDALVEKEDMWEAHLELGDLVEQVEILQKVCSSIKSIEILLESLNETITEYEERE